MKKIELKAKAFAKSYIRNKFNGTAAVKELYNPNNDHTARSIAAENLTKPIFQKAIIETMEEMGFNDEMVSKIHKRNLQQNKNLPASNSAADMYYKIKGHYAPEKKITLNFKYKDIQQVRERTAQLLNELQQLRAGTPNP